ncbi:MAG: hypothetical protein PHH26_04435, partial [Candidatus Thermoplasmatota archaeon]|nr:hypothetical protein [Candidatus Thermoplasmatota archaeon]
ISALIFYVCFILDAFGLGGISFIAVRIITAEAALIGYVAYFPPKLVRKKRAKSAGTALMKTNL